MRSKPNWFCKFTVPTQLTTTFDDDTNQDSKKWLRATEHFKITTTNKTSLSEELSQATHQLLQEADLSWVYFIPALPFANNMS
jgi:hypothetical protein